MEEKERKRKYRAVYFDMDGTLADTIGDLASSMNRTLAFYGLEGYTVAEFKMMVGRGVRHMAEPAFGGRGVTLKEEHLDHFVADYRENCVVDTKPYEGIPELLEELEGRGIILGVITNKAEDLALKISDEIFGEGRFAFFRGGRDDFPLKPDPAGVLLESEKLGLTADEIIFVGDSAVDMETAVNAGVYPCGVNWGFRSEDELKAGGSAKILSRPVDLLGLMD